MTTSAIFIPLPGFTWVSRGRSVEVQFCDKGEEFRNCGKNARKSPTTGAVNYVVSTKNSPASGWCLRGSLISVVPLPDNPYACPPVGLPGAPNPQQRVRGVLSPSPFVHPSILRPLPEDARFPTRTPLASNGTMPTTVPTRHPSKPKPVAIWRLKLAGLCLRITRAELERGRYGRVARFGTRVAIKLTAMVGRTQSR